MGAHSDFLKKLQNLSANKSLRTYTPIHAGSNSYLPRSFDNLFKFDLSEITGLDDLHNPKAGILEAQQKAARLFQVDQTFFSVNGASLCLTAACLALGEGGKVLIPRNAHKSIISGLILSGADPVWYEPCWDESWGIYRNINTSAISDALRNHRDIKACFVTAETYEGVRPNLNKIVEVCHEANVPVIADESHGGHISLLKGGAGAIDACADLVIHSAHKSLGSLTQTGLLHIQSDLIEAEKINACLNLLQSTSPSQLLLASLIETIEVLSRDLSILENQMFMALELKKLVGRINRVEILENDDPTRLAVKVAGWPGEELSKWLFEKHKIETELQGSDWVLFLVGIGAKWHQIRHLYRAIEKAAKASLTRKTHHKPVFKPLPFKQNQNPRKAFLGKGTSAISFSCPPGIPVAIPGLELDSTHGMSLASLITHSKQDSNPYFEEDDKDFFEDDHEVEDHYEEEQEEETFNFA